MSKAVIQCLIVVGILFLLFGFFSKGFLICGLLIIAAGLYFGLGPDGILRKDQVLDSWATLIENGQTNGNSILCDTESFITASKAPDIRIERKEMSPGLFSGITGKTRIFLSVTDKRNFRLSPYKIFINAEDYGDNLNVSWHLMYRPSFWQSIMALLPFINIVPLKLSDLDLFDEMDLRAYATNAHHCFLKAVDKLVLSLNQDPSKLDRKSRGFLGIS